MLIRFRKQQTWWHINDRATEVVEFYPISHVATDRVRADRGPKWISSSEHQRTLLCITRSWPAINNAIRIGPVANSAITKPDVEMSLYRSKGLWLRGIGQ